MIITCLHCGNEFSISAEQLGRRGRCPHCRSLVSLPRADSALPVTSEPISAPSHWMENGLSGVGAVVVHLLALLLLALIPWGGATRGAGDEGVEVLIGQLPQRNFHEPTDERFQLEALEQSIQNDSFDAVISDPLESVLAEMARQPALDVQLVAPSSAAPALLTGDAMRPSALAGGAEDFGQMIARLRRDGLDLVIVFDSTGSMGGEIRQIKDQIQRIGNVLFQMVPQTRISIVTYRDFDDEYVAKGIALTDSLNDLIRFLEPIRAAGGGDEPEAVDEGMYWAIHNNNFRPRAHKVMLIFGDAPPHQHRRARCLQLAAEFRDQLGGIVSTVTCRREQPLADFLEIAQMGGGEAFLARDEREIMTQLMVLVFGSQHRSKVLEAFNLLGN